MSGRGRYYLNRIKIISNNLKTILKEILESNDGVIIKSSEDKTKVIKISGETKEGLDDILLPHSEIERDATVRSKLSKECGQLRDKKVVLSSTGLNIVLANDSWKKADWGSYQFDKTMKDQKHSLVATPESGSTIGLGPINSINRPVRGEPGKVVLGFVPYEWFAVFIPKTGYTGFGTLIFTLSTYLVSKEIYVLEHNFYNGISMAILAWASVKYMGPHVTAYLDKEIDEYEYSWNKGRADRIDFLNKQIEDELLAQFQIDGQIMLIEAKRENVALQLEAEFRKRQMFVYKEVLRRLNYHLAVEKIRERYQHRNLVEYVHKEVLKAITPDMEKQMIDYSISNILHELDKKDEKK